MPHWTKPSGSDDHPNDVQTMRSWPIYTRVITPPMHICVSLRVKESRMFGYVGISRNFTIRFVVLNAKILHNSNRQALLANTNRRSYSSVTLVTRIEQSTVVLAHSGKLVVLFPSELSTTTLQTSCATYTDRMKYECSRNGRWGCWIDSRYCDGWRYRRKNKRYVMNYIVETIFKTHKFRLECGLWKLRSFHHPYEISNSRNW